jgi:hypothetical protein
VFDECFAFEATSFFVFKKGPSTALRVTKQKRYSEKQETAPKIIICYLKVEKNSRSYLLSISDLTDAEMNSA